MIGWRLIHDKGALRLDGVLMGFAFRVCTTDFIGSMKSLLIGSGK